MKLSAAIVFSTFVGAQAASLPGLLTNLYNRELSARQDIPATCVRSCQPVNALLANNCPPTSCCTSTFTQNYVACYVCVATAAGVTDYSRGEATMTALVEACRARGFPIDAVPFPRPASGTTTTTTGSATTTGTGTTTGTTSTTSTISQTTISSITTTATSPTLTRTTVTSIDSSLPTSSGATTGGNGAAAVGLSGVTTWLLPMLAAGVGMMLV